jgi:diguanylate cyclase (GGDEF)-like protein
VSQPHHRLIRTIGAARRRPRTTAFALIAALVAAMAAVGAFPAPLTSGHADPFNGMAVVAVLPARRALDGLRRRLLRTAHRIAADVHLLLAIGLVVPVLLIEALFKPANLATVTVMSAAYLAIEAATGMLHRHATNRTWALPRLLVSLAYVAVATKVGGDAGVPPIAVLFIPVIGLAAMLGGREALIVGLAASGAYLLPALTNTDSAFLRERAVALAATGILLALGTRRTVASLERAMDHLRAAMRADRRRARQLAGVEEVGRLLAEQGPTGEALETVMDLLVERFGYRYVSIYLGDSRSVRLGAQRGYDHPIEVIEANRGVVGRVMRTGRAAFIEDSHGDPDFIAADGDIVNEVSVPLVMRGDPFGVLNVEGTRAQPVDASDLATITLIGDRLAGALALAREREALARRAALFEGLTGFASLMTATLAPDELYQRIASSVSTVIPCDSVTLTALDAESGEFRIAASPNWDGRFVGARIRPGEGLTGRAIAERRLIISADHERSQWPPSLRDADIPDHLLLAAMPLIRESSVVGALALIRYDRSRSFDALEMEALPLLASQAALAISNASLHSAAHEASIRDPLTGLFNRRHLDASMDRLFAVRERQTHADRRPVSVILFDIDHFGSFNKRHGHQLGDEVLRAFGGILRERFRSSDIVARFGGEEFLVVLDGADRDEAVRLAEEVRAAFRTVPFAGAERERLTATVSAGCAGATTASTTPDALLQLADVGLAMAKQAGRDQVVAA